MVTRVQPVLARSDSVIGISLRASPAPGSPAGRTRTWLSGVCVEGGDLRRRRVGAGGGSLRAEGGQRHGGARGARAIADGIEVPEGLPVNVSRAPTVDAALPDALEKGAPGAAALAVFQGEPSFDPRFAALDNELLQPHQGSATVEPRRAVAAPVRDEPMAHVEGRGLLTPVL